MGVLDNLARAETSSDLRHHPEPCHVDVLKAAALAGMYVPIHIELYRIKYLHDYSQLEAAKALFIRWAGVSMQRRDLDPQRASRLGVQTLTAWIDDTCKACAGQRYRVIEGTPTLSLKVCGVCKGLGTNPVRKGPEGEVMQDVIQRADDAISSIRGMIEDRLRG